VRPGKTEEVRGEIPEQQSPTVLVSEEAWVNGRQKNGSGRAEQSMHGMGAGNEVTVAERIFLGRRCSRSQGRALTEKCNCSQQRFKRRTARLRSDRYSLCRAQSEVTEKAAAGLKKWVGTLRERPREVCGFERGWASRGRAANCTNLPISALTTHGPLLLHAIRPAARIVRSGRQPRAAVAAVSPGCGAGAALAAVCIAAWPCRDEAD
jgi:hypothetical protein